MRKPQKPERARVQAAREAYFAGKITANEYLRSAIPVGRRLSDRIKHWLTQFRWHHGSSHS